jgi:hypothetical protein
MRKMLFLGAMLIAPAAAKSPGGGAALAIRLVHAERVPAKVLRQAEATAGTMMASAGVHVTWVDCEVTSCATIEGHWIQFVERRPAGLHAETAGYAVLHPPAEGMAGYAVIAWSPLAALATEQDLDPGPLLGAAMAHEIGHLLLGRNSHTRSGVMVARFRRREMVMAERGELGFTDEQVIQIRAAVAALSGN